MKYVICHKLYNYLFIADHQNQNSWHWDSRSRLEKSSLFNSPYEAKEVVDKFALYNTEIISLHEAKLGHNKL